MTRRQAALLTMAAPLASHAAPPRSQMGIATTCYMTVRRFRDTYEFLEHCHGLGAAGIQSAVTNFEPAYLKKVRAQADKYGMWIEVMAGLPRSDNDAQFAKTLAAAKELGALCVRSACLGGRRYETFSSMEEWKTFVTNSHAALARAVPMAEKAGVLFAIENHKDWTVEEHVAIFKKYSSPNFGVCLDTGNNMALLDDPMEVVERLAPYAFSTHLKDMGVAEYPDGFLLAEVPFGEGMLDLEKIVQLVRAVKPKTKITLEMITRDPLKVPCLTGKYWATFPEMRAERLARMLRMVRKAKVTKPLPMLTTLPVKAQGEVEEDNVKQCLNYARERLAL
jgi:3-oxoisoapionate decarboxylase